MVDYERLAFENCAELMKKYRKQARSQRVIIALLAVALVVVIVGR